ncbi:MAG: toxin, partial [Candidatus Aenigmatarchaeota archaeon]
EIKKIQEDLVMDSHYSHEMPFDVVVVLRTNPEELRKRMKGKGWWKEKTEENIEAEIMEICKSEALERLGNKKMIEIDTTGKKPEDAVKEIMEKLRE